MNRDEIDAINAMATTQLATMKLVAQLTFRVVAQMSQEESQELRDLLTKAVDSLDETIAATKKVIQSAVKNG
ncbi:hypothetical protein SAMN05445504_2402 [Burkholderia sp. CF099]|nr:hypothetical protein SAMN05445504_2402 [Burkholderia sp. CF099]